MALFACPLPFLLVYKADLLLAILGSGDDVNAIADNYLNVLAMAVPAMVWYLCLRGVAESHGFTRPVMLVSLLALGLNIPLNTLFIYGGWGMQPLGGVGCAYATAILLALQAAALTAVVYRHRRFSQLRLFYQWGRPQLAKVRQLVALGGPIALTSFAETSLFSATTLLLAPLGAAVVAANHIAMNISVLFFMVPFSLSLATTVRVGQHLGAERPRQARFAALQALKLSLIAPLLALVVLVWGGQTIANWYTSDEQVTRLAAHLLLFAALFQFSDAVQACSLGALRGYRDTRIPFWYTLFAYWGVAVPVGYGLTYGVLSVQPWGVSGMWVGLIVGLSVAALLLLWRLKQVSAEQIQTQTPV
jgi:MATE family multidrug resistance protein